MQQLIIDTRRTPEINAKRSQKNSQRRKTEGQTCDLRVGRAGQHFVMADLLLKGYNCFQTGEGVNYDIVVVIDGKFLRLQVKTTREPKIPTKRGKSRSYMFHVRRAGKGGRRLYAVGEFDGFALVALDTKTIAYLPFTEEINKTLILRDRREHYGKGPIAPYIDACTLDKFVTGLERPRTPTA